MPTLKDIAQQFESLAKLNIQRKPNRAIDTGRLKDSISVKQTRTNKAGGAIFDLNTVYYGVYVENGTSKMKARPFAAEAADSDTLKGMVDDYMKSQVELTLMEGVKKMDSRLKKYTK
jgi:HK97 gp10 family phage protein